MIIPNSLFSEKPEKSKKSKSSKKSKRRHSDETLSEAEDGHRSKKRAKEVAPDAVAIAKLPSETPAQSLVNVSSPKKRPAAATEPIEGRRVVSVPAPSKDRKTSHSSSHSNDHTTVTNKSNGQSKVLTSSKSSSKLGGIPTDPSQLVEMLTKSLVNPNAAHEILSSDSEEDR